MNKLDVITHWNTIEALKEGKTIQFLDSSGEWKDVASPLFMSCYKYRIKPKPKSFWFNVYLNSHGIPSFGNHFTTKEAADESAGKNRIDCIEIVVPE